MRRTGLSLVSVVAIALLSACEITPPTSQFTPFADHPEDVYFFRHDTVVVRGVIWLFEEDGDPVIHGGPVGIIQNSYTYVVEVTPKVFDFPRLGDDSVTGVDPIRVAELIAAANAFCEETGYSRLGTGANIHTTEDSNLLVLHCAPDDFEYTRGALAGDDIQRNPLLRVLGVPP
jgi:hypothetical protein